MNIDLFNFLTMKYKLTLIFFLCITSNLVGCTALVALAPVPKGTSIYTATIEGVIKTEDGGSAYNCHIARGEGAPYQEASHQIIGTTPINHTFQFNKYPKKPIPPHELSVWCSDIKIVGKTITLNNGHNMINVGTTLIPWKTTTLQLANLPPAILKHNNCVLWSEIENMKGSRTYVSIKNKESFDISYPKEFAQSSISLSISCYGDESLSISKKIPMTRNAVWNLIPI